MLRLRVLGELEVFRDDQRLVLPPSRKTRALLAYLAATGGTHRRERLCSMLWDVPDDPRGALRWSLSRLRAIVDEEQAPRVVATRETVGLDTAAMEVDLLVLRGVAAVGLDTLSTDRLTELSTLFRGEFLEGLELPSQHEFQSWCAAERENLRQLQIAILSALTGRLAGKPEAALHPARLLVQVDPYNEGARTELLRLLLGAGRAREARRQFDAAERQFRELGGDAVGRLTRSWRELRLATEAAGPPEGPVVEAPPDSVGLRQPGPAPEALGGSTLVGRQRELRRLLAALDTATRLGQGGVTLVLGEPGIGKSRLIAEVVKVAREQGVRIFTGRAFDAGRGTDTFDGISHGVEEARVAGGRERFLSQSAAHVLGEVAEPTLIALDDMHWADEASVDLLHQVLRQSHGHHLAVVLGACEGELADNLPMTAMLRGLRHDGLVDELRLSPLPAEATLELVELIAPGAHAEGLARLSGGNPLFATELARDPALDPESLPNSLKELVRARVDRLPPQAAELLRWASVLGVSFPAERLRAAAGPSLDDFMAALEQFERHSLLRPVEGGEQAGHYCFSHDLVHRAVFTAISGPRRRLMHLKVAEVLSAAAAGDNLALDIAFHAAAGGAAGMAASACAAAGRRSLRLFANADAMALVRQGLHYAETLPYPERIERMMELVEIEVAASRSSDTAALIARIEQLAGEALDHDRPEHARRGYTMLARLRWEGGDWGDAQRDTLQAELVGRSADPRDRVVAMAEAARCLAMLERDLPQAEALLLEAQALARRLGIEPDAIADAMGMLRAHRGAFEEADSLFRRARMTARRDGDRVSEYLALEHLVTLDFERGRIGQCEGACAELLAIAGKLREGSELPFARALLALCGLARGNMADLDAFEAALAELRIADSKHRLAFICSCAARHFVSLGDFARARSFGEEALAAATAIRRPSDMAVAQAVLARVAAHTGSAAEREELRDRLGEFSSTQLSQTVRDYVEDGLSPLPVSA